jgi:hypothetical protein
LGSSANFHENADYNPAPVGRHIIRLAVDFLIQQVEAGKSETLTGVSHRDGVVRQLQFLTTSLPLRGSGPRLRA